MSKFDKNKEAVKIFDRYAKGFEDKYMDVSAYEEALNLFCESIPGKSPNILDLACGPGNISKYILNRKSKAKLIGIDLSEKMLERARNNNPEAEYRKMDIREIDQLKVKFQGIICSFGTPYLSKKETTSLILNANNLLSENGVFYLSTMEGSYKDSGYYSSSSGVSEQLYIHYYEKEYLIDLLTKNNFKIIHSSILEIENSGKIVKDLVILAEKKA